jgi:hypothetical protein
MMSITSTLCVNEIQTLLNSVKTDFDLIDASSLSCDLSLQMADLGHHVPHRGLERGDAGFYLCGLSLELVDNTRDVPQVLKNNVVGFICHKSQSSQS